MTNRGDLNISDYTKYVCWEMFVIGAATSLYFLFMGAYDTGAWLLTAATGVWLLLGSVGIAFKISAEDGESLIPYLICYLAGPGVAAILLYNGSRAGYAVILLVYSMYYHRPANPNLPIPEPNQEA